MGNKMCKKKVDAGDDPKAPSRFDRIFTRLHLKPNSWKSDSHLNTKQVNRYEINPKDAKNGSVLSTSKSKSSDWTDADLEVPEKDEVIHLKNPQLSFIFNDNSTPTPPPRKHKKSIREKIETVAKNSIQALQSKKSSDEPKKFDYESKTPVEEPLCVKKIVQHGCPYCEDLDRCLHRNEKKDAPKSNQKRADKEAKEAKRKKNLSVVSLPNYSELKFSVANSEGSNLKYIDSSVSNSANSLPGEVKKSATAAPAGKLENYMTRCRSFGSLLNNKLKTTKQPTDIESDDSFGGLEDWDLGILEHYNPKDASLPRPRKPKNDGDVISDIEKLIVPEEEFEVVPPVRPVRRSESLVKKMNRQAEESAANGQHDVETPPSSPRSRMVEDNVPLIPAKNAPAQGQDGRGEHSSLMRILQEFSIKDVQKRNGDDEPAAPEQNPVESRIVSNRMQGYAAPKDQASLNKRSIANTTADFINTEKESVS